MVRTLTPASKFVDYAAILSYADLTDDYNPIHVDREFAEKTEMKGLIAHGTMSLNLIWQALRKTLDSDAMAHVTLEIRFVRPVRENDTVTGGGEERADEPGVFDVWVRNRGGAAVITGTARVGGK